MWRGRTLAAAAIAALFCDARASPLVFTWLTVPQRDARRSRSSGASVSVSGQGRYVAFASYARLSAADGDSLADIYVLDRTTAALTLESTSADGGTLNSDCTDPVISADGRYLVFEAIATEDPGRGVSDIVLRDRVENTARWITTRPGAVSSDGWSGQAVIVADGSAVIFASSATNLTREPDRNGPQSDIYRFDARTGSIERISVDSGGVQPEGGSFMPAVSGDGRYVVFSSLATLADPRRGQAPPSDHRRRQAIYLRDIRAHQTVLVSGGQWPN